MEVTKVGSATEFTVNVGVSTVPTTWKSGGKVQGAIIAPRANNKSASKNDPLSAGANVLAVLNDYSFLVNSGISTTPHFYARGGSVHKDLKVVFDEPLSYTNIPEEELATIISNATVSVVEDLSIECEEEYKLVKTMRAGVLVLGSLLTKYKKAKVSLPGGCAIGTRPVDLHLFALTKLGAKIKIKNGYIIAHAKQGLIGTKIKFNLCSCYKIIKTYCNPVYDRKFVSNFI